MHQARQVAGRLGEGVETGGEVVTRGPTLVTELRLATVQQKCRHPSGIRHVSVVSICSYPTRLFWSVIVLF